jgi:hypothetical protein
MASPVTESEWLAWVASLMGGTPRQRCASAYPPDRFYCLLDELPLHLIPRQTFSSLRSHPEPRAEFSLNPLCQVLQDGEAPVELASRKDLLKSFALRGTIAWVRHAETEAFNPFWLGARLEDVVGGLASGESGLASLSDADARLLIAAGILTSPQESAQSRERWRAQIARSAELFRQRGYAPLRNLLHPFQVAALRRYYRHMIRERRICLGDNQSTRRYAAHNESVARFFHHQIASTVSAVAGGPVKASYVYLASYLSGSELKKHTDREQCEFSVTLCLDFSPEPAHETSWPIRLDTPHGSVAVHQALGDGLVYRGTRVPHYRHTLPEGQTSTSIFFHYVPLDFSGRLD